MKYCIVVEPGVDPKLATVTLFDLLGDPSLWLDNHQVIFFAREENGIAEWAEEIYEREPLPMFNTFENMASDWKVGEAVVVLGPTDEDLVRAVTATGAKYLALDDGLVELQIDDEIEEPAVVPDVEDVPMPESLSQEPAVEEVPAVPKRRQSRRKKTVVEEASPVFEAAVEEAIDLTKVEVGSIPIIEQAPPEQTWFPAATVSTSASIPFTIRDHLIAIIQIQASNATEDQLWDVVNMFK